MDFKNQAFTDQTVNLDDNTFTDCTFTRCTLIYEGSAGVVMTGCEIDEPSWVFRGAAANTFNFLAKLYAGGLTSVVETTFDNIRNAGNDPNPQITLSSGRDN